MTNEPTVRPAVFLDLDRTLYDTGALVAAAYDKLRAMGHDSADIERCMNELNDIGFSFSHLLERLGHSSAMAAVVTPEFERMLTGGNGLLMEGVLPALQRISKVADCILVTCGYPPYQIEKYRHLSELHPLITECHFVWRSMTKGDVIRGYGVNRPSAYFENSTTHLADVKAKSPLTVCVRAMWFMFKPVAHPDDGRLWQTVDSIGKFADLVCNMWPAA